MSDGAILKVLAVLAAFAASLVLLRGAWRDLRRESRRPGSEAELRGLYHVVLAAGCALAFLCMIPAAALAPRLMGLATLPFFAAMIAAAVIRFVPRSAPVWRRVVARLRG